MERALVFKLICDTETDYNEDTQITYVYKGLHNAFCGFSFRRKDKRFCQITMVDHNGAQILKYDTRYEWR